MELSTLNMGLSLPMFNYTGLSCLDINAGEETGIRCQRPEGVPSYQKTNPGWLGSTVGAVSTGGDILSVLGLLRGRVIR